MVTCVDTKVTKMIIPFITPILKSLVVPVIWLALIDGIYSWIASIFCLNYIFFPANEEVTIKTKQPIRFQGLFIVTNQIAGKWRSTMPNFAIFVSKTLTFPPPPKKKKMDEFNFRLAQYCINKYLNWPSTVFGWFQNECKKVVCQPELHPTQFNYHYLLHGILLTFFKVYGETVANLGFNTWVEYNPCQFFLGLPK